LTLYRYWLGRLNLPYAYRKARVQPGTICDYLRNLHTHLAERRGDPAWLGSDVNEPLVEAAAALVDRLDPMAARLGVVDLIVRDGGRLLGCNSAARAFMAPLRPHLGSIARRTAMVIGSGRAARTVAHVLAASGFRLDILNRRVEHARQLVQDLGRNNGHMAHSLMHPLDPVERHSLLVNATPARRDFVPDLRPLLDTLAPDAIVYDLAIDPAHTPLLRDADRRGHPTINGIDMLLEKAASSFTDLFRHPAPRIFDRQARLLITP
jgi:shikimate dehydrogenase